MSTPPDPGRRPRRGVSYLEAVLALIVLGVGLSGLGATLAAQLRLMHALEGRAYLLVTQGATLHVLDRDPRTGGMTSYLVLDDTRNVLGSADRWAARLGVATCVVRDVRPGRGGQPGPFPIEVGPRFALGPDGLPYEAVHRVALDPAGLSDDGDTAAATAILSPAPPPPP